LRSKFALPGSRLIAGKADSGATRRCFTTLDLDARIAPIDGQQSQSAPRARPFALISKSYCCACRKCHMLGDPLRAWARFSLHLFSI